MTRRRPFTSCFVMESTNRTLISLAVSAGIGAVTAVSGVYLVQKIKAIFHKKPKLKLYHHRHFLSSRCVWLMTEMGVRSDLDIVPFNPITVTSEEKEEYKAGVHPHATVPALVIDGSSTMLESAAICMYLAELYGMCLPDEKYKTEYYSWIVYASATLDKILMVHHKQLLDTKEEERNPEVLQPAQASFHAFAKTFSHTLRKQKFVCGNKFTAADCVMGYTLWWGSTIQNGALFEDYPVLKTYLHNLRKRPAFQQTFGSENTWDWNIIFKKKGTE